jgi:LysM repeat protein
MDWRRMALFIAINAVVSAAVTLLVLSWWEARRPATPVSTPRPPDAASTADSTLPAEPTRAPTPAGPFAYTIQAGDTLGSLSLDFDVPLSDLLAANGLAEDAILSIGQVITIPLGGLTTTAPESTASPAATAGAAFVVIREIVSPGALPGEAILLTNLGGRINLLGWMLSDGKGNRYTFPDVTLFADAEISLHTAAGTNTPSDLFWAEGEARWGTAGTVAYLRDASGKLVAIYRVP